MFTALFKELCRQGLRVRYITIPYYQSILEDCPYIDTLIVIPDDHPSDTVSADQYAEALTGEKADAYFALNYPAWWNYPGLPSQVLHQHMIDYFAAKLNISAPHDLTVHLNPEMRAWASQFSDCVLIQTKTAWSPYKNWPIAYWEQLCQRIHRELGVKVLQIGHESDPGVEGIPRIVAPSIRHAVATIEACRLFIGLDSVFNHAAKAVKKRSIILWGSTNPAAFGYAQNINLVNGCEWKPDMGNGPPLLKCQPCYREYKHIEADAGLACPYTVVDKHEPQASSVPACMAANSVPIVFRHVKNCVAESE